jgi:hypothetical protein
MKIKRIVMAVALLTTTTCFSFTSWEYSAETPLTQIASLDQSSSLTILEVNKNLYRLLQADRTLDDDIYFQGGVTVKETDLFADTPFCAIDTDNFTDTQHIYEGSSFAVKNVSERINFKQELYEVRIELSIRNGYTVDELECVLPIKDMRELTIGDLNQITGNAFSIKNTSIQ